MNRSRQGRLEFEFTQRMPPPPDMTTDNIMTSISPMHLSERVAHRIGACMTRLPEVTRAGNGGLIIVVRTNFSTNHAVSEIAEGRDKFRARGTPAIITNVERSAPRASTNRHVSVRMVPAIEKYFGHRAAGTSFRATLMPNPIDSTPLVFEQNRALDGIAPRRATRFPVILDAVHRRTCLASRGLVGMPELVRRTIIDDYSVPEERKPVSLPGCADRVVRSAQMSAKPPCRDYRTANSAFRRADAVLHLDSLKRASPLLDIVRNYR